MAHNGLVGSIGDSRENRSATHDWPEGQEPMNLRKTREWLSVEVEIRLPRAWLLIGAAGIAVLSVLALD